MGQLIYTAHNDSTSKLLSFRSLMETPIQSLNVYFTPQQAGSGNASPTNARAITGRNSILVHKCGINLLKCTGRANGTSQGIKRTFHLNSDDEVDEITLSGTTSQANAFYNLNYVADKINVFKGNFALYGYSNQANLICAGNKTYYTLTNTRYDSIDAGWNIWYTNRDGETQAWIRMQIVPYVKGTVVDTKVYPMMCLPQDAGCQFQPYKGEDITVTLDNTYYGGIMDVVSGIFIQTWYSLNPLDLTWTKDSETTNNVVFCCSDLLYPMIPSTLISNHFNINETTADTQGYMTGNDYQLYLTISKSTIGGNTVEDFQTWLTNNSTLICYQLATPIVHQLEGTPLMARQGRNNIWTETLDEIDASYKLYESTFIQKSKYRAIASVPNVTTIISGNTQYSTQVAHFTTTSAKTIRLLQVNLTPIQEGANDPSPTNIRNITGRSSLTVRAHGKNFLRRPYYHQGTNPRTINQVVFTVNSDGTVTASGTASSSANYYFSSRTNEKWAVPLGQYVLNGRPTNPTNNSNIRIGWNHGSVSSTQGNDVGSGVNVNVTDGFGPFGSWITVASAQQVTDYTFYPMLRLASDDNTYEGFSGTIIDLNLANTAGTLYGGTIDIISGVIKVEYVLETLTWGGNYASTKTFTDNQIRVFPLTYETAYNSISSYPSICNIAPFSYDVITDSIHQFVQNNKAYICLPKTTSSDTSIQICYKLQNPIVYNLTPQALTTQQGINNIWSTDGSVIVKY